MKKGRYGTETSERTSSIIHCSGMMTVTDIQRRTSDGGSKDQAPGVGMKQGHYGTEAAGATESHHVCTSDHHGM